MTQVIVKALEITGQRGIMNKGWGGLGNCKFLHWFVSLCRLVLLYLIQVLCKVLICLIVFASHFVSG